MNNAKPKIKKIKTSKKVRSANKNNTKKNKNVVTFRSIDPQRDTQLFLEKGIGSVMALYPDLSNYTKVLFDPSLTESAGIPHYPILRSYPLRVRTTGFGKCNAQGIGWITSTQLGGVANDLKEIYVTNGPNAPSLIRLELMWTKLHPLLLIRLLILMTQV